MTSHQDTISRARRFVPPLSTKLHKGQAGRVGVVGGSADYSGAPYFSSMSSLRAGADLAHVFCTPSAGAVIKTYSPDLIVHTLFNPSEDVPSIDELEGLMKRLHVLVIGPGLGRDDYMQSAGKRALEVAKKLGLWVVLDADGLYAVTQDPSIIQGYEKAILTPNIMEFKYLSEKMGLDAKSNPDPKTLCPDLAKALGHVTILQKGETDIISNGHPLPWEPQTKILESETQGGLKRCGGQGDVLSGTTGCLIAWAYLWAEGTYDDVTETPPVKDEDMRSLPLLAAYTSSTATRLASRRAFEKLRRAMQTTDVMLEVGPAFEEVLGLKGQKD